MIPSQSSGLWLLSSPAPPLLPLPAVVCTPPVPELSTFSQSSSSAPFRDSVEPFGPEARNSSSSDRARAITYSRRDRVRRQISQPTPRNTRPRRTPVSFGSRTAVAARTRVARMAFDKRAMVKRQYLKRPHQKSHIVREYEVKLRQVRKCSPSLAVNKLISWANEVSS